MHRFQNRRKRQKRGSLLGHHQTVQSRNRLRPGHETSGKEGEAKGLSAFLQDLAGGRTAGSAKKKAREGDAGAPNAYFIERKVHPPLQTKKKEEESERKESKRALSRSLLPKTKQKKEKKSHAPALLVGDGKDSSACPRRNKRSVQEGKSLQKTTTRFNSRTAGKKRAKKNPSRRCSRKGGHTCAVLRGSGGGGGGGEVPSEEQKLPGQPYKSKGITS